MRVQQREQQWTWRGQRHEEKFKHHLKERYRENGNIKELEEMTDLIGDGYQVKTEDQLNIGEQVKTIDHQKIKDRENAVDRRKEIILWRTWRQCCCGSAPVWAARTASGQLMLSGGSGV